MIQPHELKSALPMNLSNGVTSTTTVVWNTLVAAKEGQLNVLKKLVSECAELAYAQYNYAPPIHFAVREGHTEMVDYLLSIGAHDPSYKIYPFQDSLDVIAQDRGHHEIADMLERYSKDPTCLKFKGDNGAIDYQRNDSQRDFETAVDKEDIRQVEKILQEHPEFARDQTYFWGEGILMMPAKAGNVELCELLMRHGATVPQILKWAQFYYFEQDESAEFLMENGMNPDVMSWHHVTLLHDMAQKGEIKKASLLIKHGAEINAIDDEYQSTPLGMAARWGHTHMVEYLLEQGADARKAGRPWATPLAWAQRKKHTAIEHLLKQAGA
jgi:uncharacterized protein